MCVGSWGSAVAKSIPVCTFNPPRLHLLRIFAQLGALEAEPAPDPGVSALQPTDRWTDEWNYGCGGACTALAKRRRSGAQIWRDRGVVTLRQVGKRWPSPPSLLQLWGPRRGAARSFVRSGADGLPPRPVSSSAQPMHKSPRILGNASECWDLIPPRSRAGPTSIKFRGRAAGRAARGPRLAGGAGRSPDGAGLWRGRGRRGGAEPAGHEPSPRPAHSPRARLLARAEENVAQVQKWNVGGVRERGGVCARARARARPGEGDWDPAGPSIARLSRGPAAPPPAWPGPASGPLARRPAWSCQPSASRCSPWRASGRSA